MALSDYFYANWKDVIEIGGCLRYTDIILTDGKYLVGLGYFLVENYDVPLCTLKMEGSFVSFVCDVAKRFGIVVRRSWETKFFKRCTQNEMIKQEDFNFVATLYSKLHRWKDYKESEKFEILKNRTLEASKWRRAVWAYSDLFKKLDMKLQDTFNEKTEKNATLKKPEIITEIENSIQKLADEKKLNCTECKISSSGTETIVLSKNPDAVDILESKSLRIYIDEKENNIGIVNQLVIKEFPFEDYKNALQWIRLFFEEDIQQENTNVEQTFSMNFKTYEITKNVLSALLSQYYNENEIINRLDATYVIGEKLQIQKDEESYYEVIIPYDEFNKNMKEYIEFLKAPESAGKGTVEYKIKKFTS